MSDAYLTIILVALFVAGGIALLWGTKRKNKLGFNLKRTVCPACGTQAPIIRKPRSFKQAMWGGWTCTKCGQEIDKWGRAVVSKS